MLRELLRDVRRFRGDEEQAPKCNLATPNDAIGEKMWIRKNLDSYDRKKIVFTSAHHDWNKLRDYTPAQT